MKAAIHVDEHLFDGGPPLGLERKLRLIRSSTDQRFARRILIGALISWLPLAVFIVVQELSSGVSVARSFLQDVNVHIRFLVAAPLFILAEGDTIPRFSKIACHFLSSGVVVDSDSRRYSLLVDSTKRLLNSNAVEIVLFLFSYALAITLVLAARHTQVPIWHLDGAGPLGLSLAGLWHAFVSVPMLMVLLLGWLWRIFVWWRFTATISRFNLHLIAAHPDQAGGLRFVSLSIRGYRLLALAISAIVAGNEMSIALQTSQPSLLGARNAFIVVAVFMFVLSVGPLAMFLRNLRAARASAIYEYGSLGRALGVEFERKWFDRSRNCDRASLEVSDFSATTDLYSVVGNVYKMKDLPLPWSALNPIIVACAVPFIPVALMAVPLKELLLNLAKLLL